MVDDSTATAAPSIRIPGWKIIGRASLDSDADIAKVERFRKSKRLSTSVVRSTNPKDMMIRPHCTGGPVAGISFSADSNQTSLGGESTCVPGDSGKLIDDSE